MNAVIARFRSWAGAPQVFEVTAFVAFVLLLLLESQTPWSEKYVAEPGGGLLTDSMVPPPWAYLGSILLMGAPLAALRSLWLGVLLVLPRLVTGVVIGSEWPWTAYAALVAVAVCASWRLPRTAWLVATAAVAQPLVVIADRGRMMTPGGFVEFGFPGVGNTSTTSLATTGALYVAATILVMLLPILLRREANRRHDLAEVAKARRTVARDAAVLGERSRLARDLHDVVAHHVSLIAVRAETAPYTYPDLSADARAVLAEIADDSRKALEELRGVLGVLRRSDGEPERAPLPTAVDIGQLVAEAQSATEAVSASLDGLGTVEQTPGYVAYRVVQEALTNARRHAPGEQVDVVAHGDGAGGIRVVVSNRVSEEPSSETGGGLTGMAERVAAVGGDLETGCRDGEFVVEARLPAATQEGSR